MKRWDSIDESTIYPGGEFNGTPYSLWRCEDQVVMILETSAPEESDLRAAIMEVARQEIREVLHGRNHRELSIGIVFLDEVLVLGRLSHAGERNVR